MNMKKKKEKEPINFTKVVMIFNFVFNTVYKSLRNLDSKSILLAVAKIFLFPLVILNIVSIVYIIWVAVKFKIFNKSFVITGLINFLFAGLGILLVYNDIILAAI